MGKLVMSLLVFALLSSCSKNSCDEEKQDKLSYDYFSKNLKSDMKYNTIVDLFGAPHEDKGSGIHIYVYKLTDATEIWIGFTDHIHYARHLDSNGVVLHTLF